MSKVFTHEINLVNENGYPVLTEGFAIEVLELFGGGHTPAIRDALLALERGAAQRINETSIAVSEPKIFTYNFDGPVALDEGFVRLIETFFAGTDTPALRNAVLQLRKAIS